MESRQADRASEPQARRFAIYGLVDPRDGLVHYVGRTCINPEKRRKAHVSERRSAGGKAKQAWLADVLSAGLEPSVRVLESFDHFNEANRAESKWIAHGKAEGWPLTNGQMKGGGGNVPKDVRQAKKRADWLMRRRIERGRPIRWTVTFRDRDARAVRLVARLLGISPQGAAQLMYFDAASESFERILADVVRRRRDLRLARASLPTPPQPESSR